MRLLKESLFNGLIQNTPKFSKIKCNITDDQPNPGWMCYSQLSIRMLLFKPLPSVSSKFFQPHLSSHLNLKAPIPMELVPLDKDFPAKSQGVQMLKLMEFITFSTSLTSPLLGVAVTVNYSHLSNGVKSLHLSRSHFETLIQAVGNMSYSPDAMVLQIQANNFSLKFLYKKNPGCI